MGRRHQRFKVTKGLCVRFSTDDAPHITRLAEIVDISMGGLAIRYTSRRNYTEGLSGFTMLTCDERSAADATLPCRGVYDRDCELTSKGCIGIPPLRRCGLEFGNLSTEQVRQVKNFIKDHTSGNVPDDGNIKGFPQSTCSCNS